MMTRSWKLEDGSWKGVRGLRARRGTAEIELLMVIPLLLAFLFITKGTLQLGEARIRNAFNAEQKAYHDAIRESPPEYTNGQLQPVDGFALIRPGLPNRMHDNTESTVMKPLQHVPLKQITLTEKAAFGAPAWSYTGFPVHDGGGGFNDATSTADWFSDYAGEVRSAIEDPLGLSPSSPP